MDKDSLRAWQTLICTAVVLLLDSMCSDIHGNEATIASFMLICCVERGHKPRCCLIWAHFLIHNSRYITKSTPKMTTGQGSKTPIGEIIFGHSRGTQGLSCAYVCYIRCHGRIPIHVIPVSAHSGGNPKSLAIICSIKLAWMIIASPSGCSSVLVVPSGLRIWTGEGLVR